MRDPLIRGIASGYLPPLVGYWLAIAIVLIATGLMWRRRVARQVKGLAIEPASTAAAKLAGLAIGLVLFVAALNGYFGVPYVLPLLGALVLARTWFTEQTVTGRHIYAIGGNAEAARRAGIPVRAIKVGVFTLAGAIAGWAGVISTSRQFSVSIGTGGGTLLLDAIAAAVIGGASLFGGRGRVYHAVLGALVIGSVANGLSLLGSASSTEDIATGAILVVAVAIDALSRANRQNR